MSDQVRTIAVCGKGGTGKTVVSSLLTRVARDLSKRVLAVDADPAMGLVSALGLKVGTTVGQVREELIARIRAAGGDPKQELADHVDYLVTTTLAEVEGLAALAMGSSSSRAGCFCSVNRLLRSALEALIHDYQVVVVDGEAGIEQVNREVMTKVDAVIIVSDASRRGVDSAILIANLAHERSMAPSAMGVVFNRVEEIDGDLAGLLDRAGLAVLGAIPEDREVRARDLKGDSLATIPAGSPALEAMREIARSIGLR